MPKLCAILRDAKNVKFQGLSMRQGLDVKNNKLLGTSASLLVTSDLLVVTRSY